MCYGWLGELVASIAELKLPAKNGDVKSIELSQDTLNLIALVDPDQIRLAMDALVINAVEHGGPEIMIGCRRDASGKIELWVEDNGTLEDAERLDALHEPFVVGGKIENRGTKGGLGLGLPLTRRLAEMHGGDLFVNALPALRRCRFLR